jgi:hypothetical protein
VEVVRIHVVGAHAEPVGGKSAACLAEMVFRAQLSPSRLASAGHPVAALAVELAPRIMDGQDRDAIHLLAAAHVYKFSQLNEATAQLGSVTLADLRFNKDLRAVLVRELIKKGVIASENDALVAGRTAQEVAEVLARSSVEVNEKDDDVCKAAVRLANRIAEGNESAARSLMAVEQISIEHRCAGGCSAA